VWYTVALVAATLLPVAFGVFGLVYAVPALAHVMRVFGRRSDVTLEALGWKVLERPDGPTLEMLHWSGLSSGAVVGEQSWDDVTRAFVDALLRWKGQAKHSG